MRHLILKVHVPRLWHGIRFDPDAKLVTPIEPQFSGERRAAGAPLAAQMRGGTDATRDGTISLIVPNGKSKGARSVGKRMDDQLRILGQRFKSAGMSRRNLMKVAAAAAAGTVTTAGVQRYVGPGVAAAPRGDVAAAGGRSRREVLSQHPPY